MSKLINYNITEIKKEDNSTNQNVDLLPRAVMRNNSFVLLDGEWKFELDAANKGLTESWYLTHNYTAKANWPESVEMQMAKIQPGDRWHDQVIAWYEREFPLPEKETSALQPNTQFQLTFGACGYETMVWLNGNLLKTIEGEDVHRGEYTSFSYELDEQILKDENKLTVRIVSTMDADITRGKQESNVYKRGGIWYQTYTGGVRSVWLELVERNRLRTRIGVYSIIEDNLVRFNLTTRIYNPGSYKIKLNIYSKGIPGELVASDEYDLLLQTGQKQQRLVIEIPHATYWSPENPHLYRLVAQLTNKDGNISEIESYFGLRKIEARGCCVYLNGKETYLNGILYQPGVASYEEIKKHMYAMKALGCNLVRIHIAGVDPRIYKLADKLGMLLWVEVPSPHRSTKQSRENHKAELFRMLDLIATHPSVIIWSLYNEDWGAQDIATNTETQQYIMDMYHYMHIAFPQFLVVDNDGWHHISFEGKLKSDLLTAHFYTAELEKWKQILDAFVKGEQVGIAAMPLVVGDPFFYRKQVPLLVSEWGGFGFADYGGPKDNTERAEQIKLFKNELRQRSIAGDVYTQATNIEDEQNGLIDFSSGALKVPEGLLGN